ncbi:hypothetical protein BG004_003029, partial [Podila humilis]
MSTEERTLAEKAVVLEAMAVTLAQAGEEWSIALQSLRNMARIYQRLAMKHAASVCLIHASRLYRSRVSQVFTTCGSDAEEDEVQCLWDMFQALLLALDQGDFVRMQTAMDLLRDYGHNEYRDVEAIQQLARAVISQDNDFLHNNAALLVEHLLLLAQEPDASHWLLLARQSASQAECGAMLYRIQKL